MKWFSQNPAAEMAQQRHRSPECRLSDHNRLI